MSIRQTLRELLGNSAYERVLTALKTVFNRAQAPDLENEAILLSSRFNQIKEEERQGRLSSEEVRREKNRISAALIELIDKVPDGPVPPDLQELLTVPTEIPINQSPATPPPADQPNGAGTSLGKIPLLIGAVLLLALVSLIYLFPCPSQVQAFVIRALTASGVACVAYYLSGTIELNLPLGVKAGGTLGILALIYLLNPTGGFLGQDCISEVPVKVFVHGKGGPQELVLRQQGQVLMDYRGTRMPGAIGLNGEAQFDNLKVGEKVRLSVDFSEPYKSTRQDSVYTIDKSGKIYLEVALQNLDKVFGRVLFKDEPLAEVVVAIGTALRDTTDALGYYDLHIPTPLQRKEQEVAFYKKGFRMLSKRAYPQTNAPLNVVMER